MNVQRRSRPRAISWLGLLLLSQGCSTPFSGGRGIDFSSVQTAGAIRFTDPRLFRREALINERRREVTYLDTLLAESVKPDFRLAPEIVRDVEVISSMAASLGLRFDPAAGTNFRRAEETSDIQQEIVALRLQMQLDQLRRDAALFRENLAEQTEVTEGTPGSAPTTVPALSSGLTEQSAQELMSRIDNLRGDLATRLGAARTPLTAGSGTASRQDEFNDRSAYRALLNSARNAASLDELHDREGAALIRLSFSATVLPPPPEYRRALGVLQMRALPPEWTKEDLQTTYRMWLSHLNRELNQAPPSAPRRGAWSYSQNLSLQGLLGGEFYEEVDFLYPLDGVARPECAGLDLRRAGRTAPAGCGLLVLAVARPAGLTPDAAATNGLKQQLDILFGGAGESLQADPVLPERMRQATVLLREAPISREGCRAATAMHSRIVGEAPTFDVRQLVVLASGTHFLRRALGEADLQARLLVAASGVAQPPQSTLLNALDQHPLTRAATDLAREYELRTSGATCQDVVAPSEAHIPPRFQTIVRQARPVRIYELGPREQTQRISTSARAANAISIAAALAAQAPGSGVGANAGLGYSRNALGRVDALERNPLVVSFAEPATETTAPEFGWLLGPRANVDPRQNQLDLEQRLGTHDLSVDLSVPGWWPHVRVQAETAWAPNWRNAEGRTVSAGTLPRSVRVPLSPNSADMSALTGLLAGTPAVRVPTIARVVPDRVSACSETEIQIFGDHVWRAETVILGGRRFSGNQISVLPNMGGLILTVPKGAFPATDNRPGVDGVADAVLSVLTPYGPATHTMIVTSVKADGSCSEPEQGAAGGQRSGNDPAKAAISAVTPLEVSLCSRSPRFRATGQNLSQVAAVRFGSVTGTFTAAADGKRGTASFPDMVVRQEFGGLPRGTLDFEKADGSTVLSTTVTIAPATCG